MDQKYTPAQRWVFGGLTAAVAVIALMGAVQFQSLKNASTDRDWVVHTYQVLTEISASEAALERTQANARYFALSGDEQFARVYQLKRLSAARHVANLRRLTSDNASQQRRLDALDRLTAAHFSLTTQLIGARRAHGAGLSQGTLIDQLAKSHVGIEVLTEDLSKEEVRLLDLRTATMNAGSARLTWTLLSAGFLSLLLFSAAAATTARENRRRQRAETNLSESQELYRNLVESIQDYAILMLDAGGHVQSWTLAAQKIKGYSAEEIVGKHFSCFYTPEDVERGHPAEILARAASLGKVTEEGTRVRKDGSRFSAVVAITAVRNPAGELVGYSKLTHDVSERAALDLQIRQNGEMFRALLESAPDAAVVSSEQGTIQLANARAECLFGYTRDEMVGRPVEMLLTGAHRKQEGIRKNREEFPVEVSSSPIATPYGAWVAYAIRDVSERIAIERQLVDARQRAEDASRAKSEFLATMSHEIRTPMNAILGMAELLGETSLDPQQRQYVEIFQRSGSNLMTLIGDVLDLSKIEAGHMELEQIEFDLEEVLEQATELIAAKACAKGLQVMCRVAPGTSLSLVGDPSRLRQVILNLLGNAVKFTDAGEVVLTAKNHGSGAPGKVEFSVRDTGVGIPAGKLETIFENFSQADSSTTRKYGGTGLGLAISKRLVEQMGGRVTVTSVPGTGSTFRFDAGFGLGSEAPRKLPAEMNDFHGRSVLVVDDNSTNRLILQETLSSWGLKVSDMASPSEAISRFRAGLQTDNPFSLAVLDSRMPGVDGFDVAAEMRASSQAFPIIMLTSDPHPGDAARARELKLAGHSVKPVRRKDLQRMVCSALSSTAAASPEIPVAAPAASPSVTALNILIAEDSPDNRLLMQAYLHGVPHQFTFAGDGQAAVDQFASGQFDLILMDVQMPTLDGLSATRAIRALEREKSLPRTPIIALTANAYAEDIEKSGNAGCDGHVAKPFSKQKLLSVIAEQEPRRRATIRIEIPDGLEELAPTYLAARKKEVAGMLALLAASDFDRLKIIGHNLKGTGASYGLQDLTDAGGLLEKSAASRDAASVDALLQRMETYLGCVELV